MSADRTPPVRRWPGPLGALLVALLVLVACSGDDAAPPTGTDPPSTTAVTTTRPPSTSTSTTSPTTTATPTTSPTTRIAPGSVTFTVDDGLAADDVVAIDVNEDGTTWATVRLEDSSVTFARLEGDRWATIDPPSTLYGEVNLAAGPVGTAWVVGTGFGGTKGLWEFDGGDWTVHSDCSADGVGRGDCTSAVSEPQIGAVGGDGDFWSQGYFSDGTEVDCGFLRRDGDGWVTYSVKPTPGVGFTGFCLGEDFGPDGHPHALTADGLFRLDDEGWTRLTETGGTPEFADRSIAAWAIGADGVVWVIRFDLAEALLVWEQFDGDGWTTYPIGFEGIGEVDIDQACVLAEDPLVDPAELEARLSDPIERAFFVNGRLIALGVEQGGGVWTAISCSGVQLTDPADGSVAETITTADGTLPSLRITDLEVGPGGEVWVATRDGVTRVVR